MKKVTALFIMFFLFLSPGITLAQEDSEPEVYNNETIQQMLEDGAYDSDELNEPEFEQAVFKSKVIKINYSDLEKKETSIDYGFVPYQEITIKPLEGRFKDQEIDITNEAGELNDEFIVLKEGDIIVSYWDNYDEVIVVTGINRSPVLIYTLIAFVLLSIVVLQLKAWKLLLNIALVLTLLVTFVFPQIISGINPLAVTFIAVLIIMFLYSFLINGVNKISLISFMSSMLIIIAACLISYVIVSITKIHGLNGEQLYLLSASDIAQTKTFSSILFVGFVLSVTGLVNTLSFNVAKRTFNQKNDGFFHNLKQNKEHTMAFVNTLMLLIAAISLPLLYFFVQGNNLEMPLWYKFNLDSVTTETVRMLIGGIVLLLTTPITIYLTLLMKKGLKKTD
jgi:uncharacterized membrane protein